MNLLCWIFIIAICLVGCNRNKPSEERIQFFRNYYDAVKNKSDSKWNYTSDTLFIWFDNKGSKPNISIKGTPSKRKWSGWDSVMNSKTYYDSLWFDEHQDAIKGYFYERNDFYDLIGRPPNKTLRTYWFANHKIKEILIYWIPEENESSDLFLPPILEWAKQFYPEEINYLYANETIEPSIQNAVRWKVLLKKYRHFADSLNSIR